MTRPDDRDCIPPPAPSSWWRRRQLSKQLDRLEKHLSSAPPPSKAWRDVETMSTDTAHRYVVETAVGGRFLVRAVDFASAALKAASAHFGKESARRLTGDVGCAGDFEAFNLDEENTIVFRLSEAT